jgi:hypothetical protein
MEQKSREADILNAENDMVVRMKQEKIKNDLEEAAKEPTPFNILPEQANQVCTVTIPSRGELLLL